MGSFLKCRPVRIARVIFRWVRIVVWFCIFLVVAALAHLYLIGLPGFLKARLLAQLREAGFQAQFVDARLGWGPDIEILNAFFHSDHPMAPRLSAARTSVHFDWHALRHGRLDIRSFLVEDGRLEFPLSQTNGQALSVNGVVLSIDLGKTNTLRIAEASGAFHGIQIVLNGTATNYTAMLDWKPFHVRSQATESYQDQLQRFARALDQIHFKSAPQLHVNATADGNDPDTFRADFSLTAGPVQTPWGQAGSLKLSAAASHLATPTSAPILRAQLSCSHFSAQQGRAEKIDLTAVLSRNAASNYEAAIHLRASQLHSDHCEILLGPANNWLDASHLQADGSATFAVSNFAPLGGGGIVEVTQAAAHPGSAQRLYVDLKASKVARSSSTKPDWGPLSEFDGIEAEWHARGNTVSSPKFDVERFSFSGKWRPPMVTLDKIAGRAYGGDVSASASYDASSRELRIKSQSELDPHRVSQLLSPPAQQFLNQCEWDKAPKVDLQTRVVLPAWSDRPPGWHSNLLGSVRLAGHFVTGHAAFRTMPASSTESDFLYSNRVWDVPHLRAMTSGGEVYVGYRDSELSHDFHFAVDGQTDPAIAAPLIPTNARVWLDEVRFTTPPVVHGELSGRWHTHERLKLNASLSVSNFWFRDEKIDSLNGNVDYTNSIVRLSDVRVAADHGELSTSEAEGNISTKEGFVTNAVSTLNLDFYRRLLGSRTPEFMDEIHFDAAPTINLSGTFVATNPLATVAHFTVSGDHFRWTNLVIDNISGLGSWVGHEVALTNVHATLYSKGTLSGWGVFDYLPRPRNMTTFRGNISVRELNLRDLVRSWTTNRNRIEGMLDADLVVTDGNNTTNTSWRAFGSVRAHDALLWDFPMFGILTPVLNAISPGMGESRAHDATATFQITNGVATTDDMMIHATGISLSYRGSINVNKQINARVEAHNVLGPVVGLFLSPLSKLFEYKITGSITHPMMEPLYIPNFLMKIVRPFHTLKQLMPSAPAQTPPPEKPADGVKHKE